MSGLPSSENLARFWLRHPNDGMYGRMDGLSEFSVSKRPSKSLPAAVRGWWWHIKVESVSCRPFSILKIGCAFGCSTTTTGCLAEWMARANLVYQRRLARHYQRLAGGSGGISNVEIVSCRAFSIPTIRRDFGCSTTTTDCMTKWMIGASSEYLIDLECHYYDY